MGQLYHRLKGQLAFLVTLVLVVSIVFLLLFNKVVLLIGPGEAGVLYRTFFGGTVTTKVYDEGIQFIWPWDKMYIYNTRVQEVPHDFDVLTKNGLNVHLKLSIRYRPEYKLLGKLHKNVGTNYVNTIVIPEIESVLRILIGKRDAENVYMTKRSLVEKAINFAKEQIAQRYVNVDDVIIKRIVLPTSVEKSIKYKIQQKHMADAYLFKLIKERREKERKRIEAEGLEIFQKALTSEVLHWMGIQATLKVAESKNAKTVLIGPGKEGLPIIGSLPLEPFRKSIPESGEKQELTKTKNEVTTQKKLKFKSAQQRGGAIENHTKDQTITAEKGTQ